MPGILTPPSVSPATGPWIGVTAGCDDCGVAWSRDWSNTCWACGGPACRPPQRPLGSPGTFPGTVAPLPPMGHTMEQRLTWSKDPADVETSVREAFELAGRPLYAP